MDNFFRHCLMIAVLSACWVSPPVRAGAEQLIPVFIGREIAGPAGGSTADGLADYLELLNRRDGGINGVRLRSEKCEAAFDDRRGAACFDRPAWRDAAVLLPMSSGVSDGLSDLSRRRKVPMLMVGYGRADAADGRAFPFAFPLLAHRLSQAAAQISYIGSSEGGLDRLRGKQIAYLSLDDAAGREALELLQALAAKTGFELIRFAAPQSAASLQASWDAIARQAPDWVLLAGPGPMTAAALKAAGSAGFPAHRIIGFGLNGDEQDVLPAGDAAVGYIAAVPSPAGTNFGVLREIRKHVLNPRQRGVDAPAREIGSSSYNRGVIQGVVIAGAIRIAHQRFGAKILSGEQLQWGLERLSIDEAQLAELGALELVQPLQLSCRDHEGGGAVKFQQWLGNRWNVITDWTRGDTALVRQLVEASARRHVDAIDLPLRDCQGN